MDGPIQSYVQSFTYFIFCAYTQGDIGSKHILFASRRIGGSQTTKDERHQRLGSPIISTRTVWPEVILEHEAGIYQRIVKRVRQPGIVREIRIHIVRRSFYLAEANIQPQVFVWVDIISSHNGSHRLHILENAAIKVALIRHSTYARTYLQSILRVILRLRFLNGKQADEKQQAA